MSPRTACCNSATKITACLISIVFISVAVAEEGGSGHYMPGSMSSFIDGVPGEPTFITRIQYIGYDGSAAIGKEFPFAGRIAANVSADSKAVGLTLVWAPDWNLGEKWSYAMTGTVPWVDITVAADVSDTAGGPTVRRSDNANAIGDLVLIPVMLRYKYSPDLSFDTRLTVYAPTGDYTVGSLANTGKNFWTIEPTVALMYFGQKNGREGSLFFGASFNQENPDTNYKSGAQIHLDGTLAQHFPLWKGLAGAGISGYWYKQVSGDSGSGATLGDFKAQANGLGPVLSYTRAAGGIDIIAELKWIKEFNNNNRLEGDVLWMKVVGKF